MQIKKKCILNLLLLSALTLSILFYPTAIAAVPIGQQITDPVITNEPSSQPAPPDPASSQTPPISSSVSEVFPPLESEPVPPEPPLSSEPAPSQNPEEIPSETPDVSSEEPSEKPSSSSKPDYGNDYEPSYSQRPSDQNNAPTRPGVTHAPDTVASAAADSRPVTSFVNGDLDELLSMSEPSSSESSSSSKENVNGGIFQEESSNGSTGSNNGPSSLLLGGIALIFLALCGIGFVVYQHLFVAKHPPNRRDLPSVSPTVKPSGLIVNKKIPPIPSSKASPNVYQDGYYDDPNDDPYSDYYDDIDYGNTPAKSAPQEEYTDISGSSSSETFTDINTGSSSMKPQQPKQNGSTPEDIFDWDSFFNDHKK